MKARLPDSGKMTIIRNDKVYKKAYDAAIKAADEYCEKRGDQLVMDTLACVLWVLVTTENYSPRRCQRLLGRSWKQMTETLIRYDLPDGGADVAHMALKQIGVDVNAICRRCEHDPHYVEELANIKLR